jgi:hypothetical protein
MNTLIQMAKTKATRKRTPKRSNKPLSAREHSQIECMARLAYSWGWIDHTLVESGEPIPDCHHCINLLAIATPEKIEATYTVANGTLRHWQSIVIIYVRDGEDEYRSWAWVKTHIHIIESGNCIRPLVTQATNNVLEGIDGESSCYARATTLEPWDANYAICPGRYAVRRSQHDRG